MLLAFKNKIASDVFMHTGYHIICIKNVYRKLGRSSSNVFACLVRMRYDWQVAWMTAFIECTEEELEALLSLQTEYPLLHIAELEELICKLYSKNEYVKTFAVARYHVYTQNGHQAGKHPPICLQRSSKLL